MAMLSQPGWDKIKKQVQKQLQAQMQKLNLAKENNPDQSFQLGKLNDDRSKATLENGQEVPVTLQGTVNDYSIIGKAGNSQYVAIGTEQQPQMISGGGRDTAVFKIYNRFFSHPGGMDAVLVAKIFNRPEVYTLPEGIFKLVDYTTQPDQSFNDRFSQTPPPASLTGTTVGPNITSYKFFCTEDYSDLVIAEMSSQITTSTTYTLGEGPLPCSSFVTKVGSSTRKSNLKIIILTDINLNKETLAIEYKNKATVQLPELEYHTQTSLSATDFFPPDITTPMAFYFTSLPGYQDVITSIDRIDGEVYADIGIDVLGSNIYICILSNVLSALPVETIQQIDGGPSSYNCKGDIIYTHAGNVTYNRQTAKTNLTKQNFSFNKTTNNYTSYPKVSVYNQFGTVTDYNFEGSIIGTESLSFSNIITAKYKYNPVLEDFYILCGVGMVDPILIPNLDYSVDINQFITSPIRDIYQSNTPGRLDLLYISPGQAQYFQDGSYGEIYPSTPGYQIKGVYVKINQDYTILSSIYQAYNSGNSENFYLVLPSSLSSEEFLSTLAGGYGGFDRMYPEFVSCTQYLSNGNYRLWSLGNNNTLAYRDTVDNKISIVVDRNIASLDSSSLVVPYTAIAMCVSGEVLLDPPTSLL